MEGYAWGVNGKRSLIGALYDTLPKIDIDVLVSPIDLFQNDSSRAQGKGPGMQNTSSMTIVLTDTESWS